MGEAKNVLIAMPAYNEGKVIGSVIECIKKEGYKTILVVDDCSKDDTSVKAKKAGAHVLRHAVNKGPGAATATALSYALKNNFDYVVFLDSDGQHDPKDINKLLAAAPSYDVVIGSRIINNKNMPLQRKLANRIGSVATWFFFGLYVHDSQSGFKVFNRRAMERVRITFDRYEFCSEIIGEIHKKKLTFKEVPIQVIYTGHSKSKGQSIPNGFKMIFRFIFRKR